MMMMTVDVGVAAEGGGGAGLKFGAKTKRGHCWKRLNKRINK